LTFLQGKNVKVSIFIQENLQDSNSIIYLPMNEVSPPFVNELGIIKNHFKEIEEKFDLKLNKCFSLNKNNDRMGNFSTDFGKNMFGISSLHFVGRIKKRQKEEEKNKNEPENGDDFGLIGAAPVPYSFENNNPKKEKHYEKFDSKEKKGKENNSKMEIKDSLFISNSNKNNELSMEQKKIISQGNKRDLNLFSSIFAENNINDDEIFEFDLFGGDQKKSENKYEEDFINIQKKNSNIKNKMNEKFGNLDKKIDEEDDLLHLMDKNV